MDISRSTSHCHDVTLIRNALAETIKANNGSVLFALIPQILTDAYGINYKVYAGNLKLKTWIEQTFPEFVVLQHDNGGDYLLLTKDLTPSSALTTDVYVKIKNILSEKIRENNGSIRLSFIPQIISQECGIDYKSYIGSLKLKTWIEQTFPEFVVLPNDNGGDDLYFS